jgi:DNA ligase 1
MTETDFVIPHLTHPADAIVALAANDSRLYKEAVVQSVWDQGMTEFFAGLQYALDPMRVFFVKKVPLAGDDQKAPPGAWGHTDFIKLGEDLSNRVVTGHAARDAIANAISKCNAHEWNNWYRRLLLKDLKCGTSETTTNKILKKAGPAGNLLLVPEYSCQLAKDGAEMVDQLKGVRLCDIKIDGVRLNTFLDKELGTVIQRTRNGAQNDNFPQLTEALVKILPHIPESLVLDGEIVSASFQELMKQLNRKKANTKDAKLALFDVIPLKDFLKGECKTSQRDRHKALLDLEPMLRKATNDAVYVVPKVEINFDTPEGRAKMVQFNLEALAAGLEGIMMKDPDAPYRTKRSEAWLKMKPWITIDLAVKAVVPGKRGTKYEHMMGAVEFEGEDDGRPIEVSVGSGWSDEDREWIWKHRKSMPGIIGEIRADAITKPQNSDTWSLRFPRFDRWRGKTPGEKI